MPCPLPSTVSSMWKLCMERCGCGKPPGSDGNRASLGQPLLAPHASPVTILGMALQSWQWGAGSSSAFFPVSCPPGEIPLARN